MALFELAQGLAAGYNGFNQGVDDERNRQRAQQDRKYQDEQRTYQQQQQQRVVAEQQRADKLRADMSGIQVDGRTQAEVLGDVSRAYGSSGNIVEALRAQEAATAAAYKQSANRFASFKSAALSMPDDQVVSGAVQMFNDDYLPTKVTKAARNPDGTIGVQIQLPDGKTMDHAFKDKNDLLNNLEAWYSPDTYNAFIKAQREAAIKAQEKMAEPRVVGPGATLTINGKPAYTNDTGFVPDPEGRLAPDGSVAMVRAPSGARGAGAGSAAGGKAVKTPIEDAAGILADQLGKADGSPEMAQRNTRAVAMLEGIYQTNPNISPRTAAYIAADATADEATGKPAKVSTRINKDTGTVDLVYRNPQVDGGAPFVVGTGSIAELESKMGRAAVEKEVAEMVSDMSRTVPESSREAYKSQLMIAATDPDTRAAYLKAAQAAGKDVAAIERQLDLVKNYGPKSGIQKKAAQPTATEALKKVGGLFGSAPEPVKTNPDSPAGRLQARQQEARAKAEEGRRAREDERAARQAAIAEEFQRDKATMSPLDLARKYDSRRFELSTKDAAELREIERQIR